MSKLFPESDLDPAACRTPDHVIDPVFLERWSPRAFDPEPLPDGVVASLLEAARWTPSSFNEQPWRFLWAAPGDEAREAFEELLSEGNSWARDAPVLGYLFARRRFSRNDEPNRVAVFDCGAFWMALTLQARMLGLYTHGMAGVAVEESYEVLGVPEHDYEAICAVAIGRYGDPGKLPEGKRRAPNDRHPQEEIAVRGRWRG